MAPISHSCDVGRTVATMLVLNDCAQEQKDLLAAVSERQESTVLQEQPGSPVLAVPAVEPDGPVETVTSA